MKLEIWHTNYGIGEGDIRIGPDVSQGSYFLELFALRRGNVGLVIGVPCTISEKHVVVDLARPLAVERPWDEKTLDQKRIGARYLHFRARFRGPGAFGYISAYFNGPETSGHIRAHFDGPEASGHIRARFDGPEASGHIRARFGGPGAFGYISAHFDGPETSGHIRAVFDGSEARGRISARFDGSETRGHISARFDGPRVSGRMRASFDGLNDSEVQALRALLEFLEGVGEADLIYLFPNFETTSGEALSPREASSPAESASIPVEQKARALLREHLPDTGISPLARRAIRQNPEYFDRLLSEKPRETLQDLSTNPTAFMLARAPLEEVIPEKDAVRLGLSVPRSAPAGEVIVLNFVAYVPALEEIVLDQLKTDNPEGVPHLDARRVSWQEGTNVRVVVYGEHLSAEPSGDQFTWNGEKEQVDFEITISKAATVGRITLKTDVYVENIRITRIWIPFDITVAGTPPGTSEISEPRSAPQTAFVSYASLDRSRVLDRVASLIIHTGMEVFMDCIKLRPSQKWRELLPYVILESDIFLLFWSSDAAQSDWVQWEWRHCLDHKGLDFIEVHPLKPYSTAPLPSELQELHGGDPLMIIREWEESRSKPD
jgi:hypothetical protein